MRYKGVEVTLDNYTVLFSDYSLDTLDEIRSALLDSTPILQYIDRDPEDLHQIRLGMLENIPQRYFSLPHDVLRLVRKVGTCPTLDQWLDQSLDTEVLRAIVQWDSSGYDVSDCDFRYLKVEFIGVLSSLLASGDKVGEFLTPNSITLDELKILADLPYPRSEYFGLSVDQLKQFARNPVLRSLPKSPHMSADTLDALVPVLLSDLDDRVKAELSHVIDGAFKYQDFQIDRVFEAYTQGLDYTRLLDPDLGIAEVNVILLELQRDRRRRFGGTLSKPSVR